MQNRPHIRPPRFPATNIWARYEILKQVNRFYRKAFNSNKKEEFKAIPPSVPILFIIIEELFE